MPRTLDIETLVENAFIAHLPIFLDTDVTVKSWDDIKYKDLTEAVRVSAAIVDQEEGTVNYFMAERVLVTIGVFTSKKKDETGREANGIRGEIREFLCQDDIASTLNTTPGLSVYNNGVIPQGSSDISDSKLWQKNLTVLVVATTVKPT